MTQVSLNANPIDFSKALDDLVTQAIGYGKVCQGLSRAADTRISLDIRKQADALKEMFGQKAETIDRIAKTVKGMPPDELIEVRLYAEYLLSQKKG